MVDSSKTIDRKWFVDRLAERRQSMRQLAAHMELDPSAVSRMFKGQREMRMDEAQSIAVFLGAPVAEILSHAGVSIDGDGNGSQIILAATITEDGEVERLRDPRPLPAAVMQRARAAARDALGGSNIVAAQVRATTGALSIWDDAVMLFQTAESVDPNAIGGLAIVRLKGGVQLLANLERARKTGEATLRLPNGKLKDVVLETATPVIAVIP